MAKILLKLVGKKDLTEKEAESAMKIIMNGRCSEKEMEMFLLALKNKGESIGEIAAFAKVMREKSVHITPNANNLVDTCGTGGDLSGTFNISTTAAFIAAGAGVRIAKHGNRSVSSICGSADVLEQLGARMLEPEKVQECIDQVGIGFMFAPYFHPTMKNVAAVRKKLGVRTVFNILGPLTNPAGAEAQVLGVFNAMLTETIAQVLNQLGTRHALVVHSEGMDEIGLGKTKISELRHGQVETYEMNAEDFGLAKKDVSKPLTKKESAQVILEVLHGSAGSTRDIAALNAAAAIYVSGKTKNIENGLGLAFDAIDSYKAMEKLEKFVKFGNEDTESIGGI